MVLQADSIPQINTFKFQLPSVCEFDLIWKYGLCRYNEVRMVSDQLYSNLMTSVLVRKGKLGMDKYRENTIGGQAELGMMQL